MLTKYITGRFPLSQNFWFQIFFGWAGKCVHTYVQRQKGAVEMFWQYILNQPIKKENTGC